MSTTERLRTLEDASRCEDNTVAWPAIRVLGLLSERHFLALVSALESRDPGASELHAIDQTINELESEAPLLSSPSGQPPTTPTRHRR